MAIFSDKKYNLVRIQIGQLDREDGPVLSIDFNGGLRALVDRPLLLLLVPLCPALCLPFRLCHSHCLRLFLLVDIAQLALFLRRQIHASETMKFLRHSLQANREQFNF